MLGDEQSEATEKSLRDIERKLDAFCSEMRQGFALLNQELKFHDISSIKDRQARLQSELSDVKAEQSTLRQAIKIGGIVGVMLLGGLITMAFRVWSGG